MNEHAQGWIDAYFDGELSAAEQQHAERHLAGCEACRQLLRDRRALSSLLQEAPPAAILKSNRQYVTEVAFLMDRHPTRPVSHARWVWLAVPVGLILAWSFIEAVIAASSLVFLIPGLGQQLLELTDYSILTLPLIPGTVLLPGWLGAADLVDWNRLTALLGLLFVGLMYAGWLAAWWSHHRHSPQWISLERNSSQ